MFKKKINKPNTYLVSFTAFHGCTQIISKAVFVVSGEVTNDVIKDWEHKIEKNGNVHLAQVINFKRLGGR